MKREEGNAINRFFFFIRKVRKFYRVKILHFKGFLCDATSGSRQSATVKVISEAQRGKLLHHFHKMKKL